jgi:hypothetical protein
MFFSCVFLTIFPANALAVEEYVFERMWPVLEQPWYFFHPRSMAIDSAGNVYVADTENHRIQKFSSSGAFITKWGSKGSGDAEFDWPSGLAIDGAGNVYVADTQNNRIQKFSSSGTFITKWGSEGAGNGELDCPTGVAIDGVGNVYVVDRDNHRVQKFSSLGAFVTKWGTEGTGDGKFQEPNGVAIDGAGNVYVADAQNNRIQKFSSSGAFITKWGTEGAGDGELDNPFGLAIDGAGNVYVVEFYNYRIQKFTSSGAFVTKWGSYGFGNGEFRRPTGVAIDSAGNVYVADTQNNRIQKFSSSGTFITKWGSEGTGDGEFNHAKGVAINGAGDVFVADWGNSRVQKFTSSGVFVTKWGSNGAGDGEFAYPYGIAINGAGDIYVVDTENHRIQKFSSSGAFITKWGSEGTGDGKFQEPDGIAINSAGDVFVADWGNNRIQKFSSSGVFIAKWGSYGAGDGELDRPAGVATDGSGNVYVADWGNHRIQKFTSSGAFITKWGSNGAGDGEFSHPIGVAIDAIGDVYVADTWNHRIQKFSSDGVFIARLGALGSSPGLLSNPAYLAVSSEGKIFVSELSNSRIQTFAPSTSTAIRKAIIVAGSGPYATNTLWDATQMCANYAYRSLTYQGYTRDTIYYLSADTDLDLDNDGSPDVDGDATNANLEYAIKTWGVNADNLFIYLVGHGGEGTFVTGEYELLDAADLDAWLDTAQLTIPDFVGLVYDGCHSGSFVPYLVPPAGKARILAVSTASNEPAVFEADGGLSFGYQFFSYLFNGGSFYDSFLHGKKSVEGAYDGEQTPQIEGNGNGMGNEKADKEIAQSIKLGNETKTAGDIPRIESVSPAQTLTAGETSALIYAQNVVDADGIQEVFAVIKPPDYSSGSSEKPVTDLPTINLAAIGNNTYSGMYNGFTVEGAYNVAVFARDGKGTLSLPVQTSVTVPTTTDCLAVAADLSIHVPCAEYNGNQYGFTLAFYRNPDDPSGYYWNLVKATLTTGEGADCILFGSDLSMPISCVAYNGTQYGFTLRFYNNPYDPSGYYWKMDMSTLVVK